jgi:hypothetical protein
VVFNDFFKDDCIPGGDGQVASGSVSLPDPVVLDEGSWSGRLIAHKFNTWWAVGVVKSVQKMKSVAGQFAVKNRQGRARSSKWGSPIPRTLCFSLYANLLRECPG